MSDQNVGFTLTANSSAVEAALDRFNNSLGKVEAKLDKVGESSKRSAKGIATGFEDAARSVGNFTASLVGADSPSSLLLTVAQSIRSEWEHIAKVSVGA